MLRKLSLVAVAAASLGAAALAPTSASAWGYGYHGGWHHGFWGPRVFVGETEQEVDDERRFRSPSRAASRR